MTSNKFWLLTASGIFSFTCLFAAGPASYPFDDNARSSCSRSLYSDPQTYYTDFTRNQTQTWNQAPKARNDMNMRRSDMNRNNSYGPNSNYNYVPGSNMSTPRTTTNPDMNYSNYRNYPTNNMNMNSNM